MASLHSPKVFISYSHDSTAHKAWVRRLARQLRKDGVDVILDQWDIGPGDDVTAFMEQGLRSCDRVLIICTPTYIRKANNLKGGVGYERMIITGQVAKDLKTKKFIPVMRSARELTLPAFLGTRIYVDFHSSRISGFQYDYLLRSLVGIPRHPKPPLGKHPFSKQKQEQSPARSRSLIANNDLRTPVAQRGSLQQKRPWKFHWHAAVHRFSGNRLYFILLRVWEGSLVTRPSIIDNIEKAGVKDYMIFQIYSDWDLLIRVWTDEDSLKEMIRGFEHNKDLERGGVELLAVDDIRHIPEFDKYASDEEAQHLLGQVWWNHLRDAQEKQAKSKYFASLRKDGLILDPSVRFYPGRIQFFLAIFSIEPPPHRLVDEVEDVIRNERAVLNGTVYTTPRHPIRLLIKGQVKKYYDISNIIHKAAEKLRMLNISTQTMLVANNFRCEKTEIDFDKAERHIIERSFSKDIPEAVSLDFQRRHDLLSKYQRVSSLLSKDNMQFLVRLMRAKANASANEMSGVLAGFFTSFESELRNQLPRVMAKVYGQNWTSSFVEIKKRTGIDDKLDPGKLVLGHLARIYKTICLEKSIIKISPLSEEEFGQTMEAVAYIRNTFMAHQLPDIEKWNELFDFCSKFVTIRRRLLEFIASV